MQLYMDLNHSKMLPAPAKQDQQEITGVPEGCWPPQPAPAPAAGVLRCEGDPPSCHTQPTGEPGCSTQAGPPRHILPTDTPSTARSSTAWA